jgi:hypothetical protein
MQMTRRPIVLLVLVLGLLGGCLPGTDGSRCLTDANCPTGQTCVALVCVRGQASADAGTGAAAALFVSGGGGSAQAAGGTQANLTLCSQPAAGTSTAPSGATMTLGPISDDSIK